MSKDFQNVDLTEHEVTVLYEFLSLVLLKGSHSDDGSLTVPNVHLYAFEHKMFKTIKEKLLNQRKTHFFK